MEHGHGRPWRRPGAALLAATATLLLSLGLCQTSSAAPIEIVKFNAQTSSAEAGANPNLTLEMSFCKLTAGYYCSPTQFGSQLNRLKFNLPAGLIANLQGRSACPEQIFRQMTSASSCPGLSQVGTSAVRIIATGNFPYSDVGQVFNLSSSGTDPGMLGIFFNPGGGLRPVRIVATGSVQNGDQMLFTAPGLTNTILNGDGSVYMTFKLADVTLDINDDGTGLEGSKRFLRNPTACGAATFGLEAGATDNSQATAHSSYNITDCAALPFAPSLVAAAGTSGQTARNSSPPVAFTMSAPDGQASVSKVQLKLPPMLRPSSAALNAHSCRPEAYEAGSCPSSAQIGSLTVNTPSLNAPVAGPIYLVRVPGQLRMRLIAKLTGPVSIDLEGSATFDGTNTVATFDGLPDVPVTSFALALNGANNGVFAAAANLCDSQPIADSTFYGKNGSTHSTRVPISITGCGTPSVSIAQSSATVSAGYVPVVVGCSDKGASCSGTLSLVTKVGRARSSAKLRSKSLGQQKFTVAAGRKAVVMVKLPKARAKELGRKRKLKAVATAKVGGASINKNLLVKAAAKSKAKKKAKRSGKKRR